jgi:membrane protein required for colicin V production
LGAVLSPELNQVAGQYLQPEIVAKVALGGGVFLIVLIIMSLISVRIADWVLDSAAGAFDRTMGFVYGLARGLVLVAIAYLFYAGFFQPVEKQEAWVKNARLLPVVKEVGSVITSFLPADIANVLLKNINVTDQNKPAAPASAPAEQDEEGYQAGQQQNLNRLIESTEGGANAAPPESDDSEPLFGGQTTTGQ